MNKYLTAAIVPVLIFCAAVYPEIQEARTATAPAKHPEIASEPLDGQILPVDIRKSTIRWRGTKFLGTASHEGTLGMKEGFLIIRNDSLTGGTIVVDMDAISVTDIPVTDTANRNLANHLKSEFDTPDYPHAKFEITDVTYLGGDSLRVRGNMSIRDVTKNISIPATIGHSSKGSRQFYAEFKLDRFAWNIGKDGSWLARRLVDQEFEVRVELITVGG